MLDNELIEQISSKEIWNEKDNNQEFNDIIEEQKQKFLWRDLEEEIIIWDLDIENNPLDKIILETTIVLWKFLNLEITKIMFKEVVDKWEDKIWLVILENKWDKPLEMKFVDSIFEDDDYWVLPNWKFIFFTN